MKNKKIILLSSTKSNQSPNQFFQIVQDTINEKFVLRLYIFKKRRNKLIKYFFAPIDIFKLILRIYNYKPDIIFTLGFSSDLISNLIPFKKFITVSFISGHLPYHYSLDSNIKILGYLQGIIHYFVCSLSDQVVCMTGSMAVEFNSITKKKSSILGNVCKPIYENLDELKLFKSRKYNKSEGYNFVFVGSLIKRKNLLNTIYSFSLLVNKYRTFKLHIYGSGPLLKKAKLFCLKHKCLDNIIFHGHESNKINIYHDADFIIHPSLSEGTSRSVLEALCLHIPVIMLPIPGAHDLIKNDFNGLIVSDLDQLENHIKRLIKIRNKMLETDENIDYFLPVENKLNSFKLSLYNLIDSL